VTQPHQFSYRNKLPLPSIKNPFAYQIARYVAREVIRGKTKDYSKGAEFYFDPETAGDLTWFGEMKETAKIGKHTFYKSLDS
jgi:spore germination cell wall hydrolase CwlJ-like protein